MIEKIIKKEIVLQRIRSSNNIALFNNYVNCLNIQGYSNNSIQTYLRCVEHYTNWLTSVKRKTLDINSKNINYFLLSHLRRCKCSQPSGRDIKTNRAALFKLLKILNTSPGVIKKGNSLETIIQEYDIHLKNMCGLSECTCFYRRRYAREFLKKIFGKKPLDYKVLTPEKIVHYIGASAKLYKRSSVGVFTCSVRSFLKFLQFKGYCGSYLADSVPRIATWKLSSIPVSLDKNKIKTLLSTFDNSTSVGKRDFAIARFLIDIGLRCSEVANLKLDDIHWKNSTIEIKKSKIHRADLLPMPSTILKVLIDYLKNGRPKTSERYIFVHHRAPFGKKISSETVRGVIRRAYKKSGFPKTLTGTHILRKSMATLMLKNGATLKQISDVLRHRCIDTTMIYTKIDITQLAKVALPSPGRVS